jgi:Domain of unknown function (DUF3883)
MPWAKTISDRAMDIVCKYETLASRTPTKVNSDGVGYDIYSTNGKEERLIEVKGVSESWETYTWQSMTEMKLT